MVIKHILVLLRMRVVTIDVIENRILNTSEAKPSIKHSPTVVSVSLPKARILMQLG